MNKIEPQGKRVLAVIGLNADAVEAYGRRDATLSYRLALASIWFNDALLAAWRRQSTEGIQRVRLYLIVERSTQVCVGTVTFTPGTAPKSQTVELGFAIKPAYRKRGYASLGVSLALKHYLRPIDRRGSIFAHVDGGNLGSRKVLAKNKFTQKLEDNALGLERWVLVD